MLAKLNTRKAKQDSDNKCSAIKHIEPKVPPQQQQSHSPPENRKKQKTEKRENKQTNRIIIRLVCFYILPFFLFTSLCIGYITARVLYRIYKN